MRYSYRWWMSSRIASFSCRYSLWLYLLQLHQFFTPSFFTYHYGSKQFLLYSSLLKKAFLKPPLLSFKRSPVGLSMSQFAKLANWKPTIFQIKFLCKRYYLFCCFCVCFPLLGKADYNCKWKQHSNCPLVGAVVHFMGKHYLTDSNGKVTIENLLKGLSLSKSLI